MRPRLRGPGRLVIGARGGLAALGLVALLAAGEARAAEAFAIRTVPTAGRPVAAEILDLDGDGRQDLWIASFEGVPPEVRRSLRVHYQRPDGSLAETPDWTAPVPPDVVWYDFHRPGAARGGKASEILLLGRETLHRLSLAGRQASWQRLALPGPSLGLVPDDRALDRMRLARPGLTPAGQFLVPGLGEWWLLSATGEVASSPEVDARAIYYVPLRPGPLLSENEVEVYYDHPRLNEADVDGDGRLDLVSTNRHELKVFRQRLDGRFPRQPDLAEPLGRLSEDDLIRSSGFIRATVADLDGDGRAELLVASATEGLLDARSELAIFRNRDGRWDLAAPDQVFRHDGAVTTYQLIDLDGDRLPELVEGRLDTGVFEIVELLVTRAMDVRVTIRRAGGGALFADEPWYDRTLGIPLSFETFRPRGFLPSLDVDLNGDGLHDFLGSGNGDAIEVFLGQPENPFRRRSANVEVDSGGRARFGDLDGDGLTDILLYDPRRRDVPVRIAINQGTLPGSRRTPRLIAPPDSDPAPAQ